jgi:hypothetical protein
MMAQRCFLDVSVCEAFVVALGELFAWADFHGLAIKRQGDMERVALIIRGWIV